VETSAPKETEETEVAEGRLGVEKQIVFSIRRPSRISRIVQLIMIFACIDGGLFCVPALILYGILSATGGLVVLKKFKWCKKACKCLCHNKNKSLDNTSK